MGKTLAEGLGFRIYCPVYVDRLWGIYRNPLMVLGSSLLCLLKAGGGGGWGVYLRPRSQIPGATRASWGRCRAWESTRASTE